MNLFSQLATAPTHEELFPGAILMRGLALSQDRELLAAIDAIAATVPFRHMTTPGGQPMSIMGTACGNHPRTNSRELDPVFRLSASALHYAKEYSGTEDAATAHAPRHPHLPRPPLPTLFRSFATRAASLAGFVNFRADAGLVNRYQAGNKLGLHQDRNESDVSQPIVSVSLGLPAIFLMGGFERSGTPRRILLEHGDVIVWGGPSRMRFHGVLPLKPGSHLLTGIYRLNLTLRKVT